MDGLMIQICLYYNPFNLMVLVLFKVIIVMIERR